MDFEGHAMKVTDRTRRVLHYRRTVKAWLAEGFEEVGESGGNLWQIYRGCRQGQIIHEARIAPDGMSLFIRVAPPPHCP